MLGDALGCAIVQRMCSKELAAMDKEDEQLKEQVEINGVVIENKGDIVIEMGTLS